MILRNQWTRQWVTVTLKFSPLYTVCTVLNKKFYIWLTLSNRNLTLVLVLKNGQKVLHTQAGQYLLSLWSFLSPPYQFSSGWSRIGLRTGVQASTRPSVLDSTTTSQIQRKTYSQKLQIRVEATMVWMEPMSCNVL